MPFPRALCEPFVCAAFRPFPSNGGSLWVRLQFYFRFIGLKHLYHIAGSLSTLFVNFFQEASCAVSAVSV